MDIKPIETVYNGYRFRSRLEARWAVFFDAAGIEYQYEPEGYVLDDGTKYLPDFYLPGLKAFVEIKHSNLEEDALEKAKDKCAMLNCSMPENVVLLCFGDPVDMNVLAFYSQWQELVMRYVPEYDSAVFIEGARWWKASMGESGHIAIHETRHAKHQIAIAIGELDYSCYEGYDHPYLIPQFLIRGQESFLESARWKARQARFEHGETPNARR